MIRINELKMPIGYTNSDITSALSRMLNLKPNSILGFEIVKQSIDSRKKENIKYVLNVAVDIRDEVKFLQKSPNYSIYTAPQTSIEGMLCGLKKTSKLRPVVVGSGPAGLFCALTLATCGLKPILVERGKAVDERILSIAKFNSSGQLDTESNIQFGEGGAGTFSDGKLNTGVGGDKISVVLNEFVRFGAPQEILYDSKPHIGTDKLIKIVKNMREKLIELGGEVHFSTKLSDILTSGGKLVGVVLDGVNGRYSLDCDKCILAVGHSARDTFEMLSGRVSMESKAFSIGVRIEHLQQNISEAQYGASYKLLPPADYKLACHLDSGRSCYTFCMCPGGYVVPAASELESVVTNGMSYFARDGQNANSALLVGVDQSDFGEGVLAGVEFQRKYERLAYKVSNSCLSPCQRYGDLQKNISSSRLGSVKPTYAQGVELCDLRACLPNFVTTSIVDAVQIFDKKIKGFADGDALLCGVESRSSSPVRILRGIDGNSSLEGLYPCGEGAGYAGGITSAAVDGIVTALNVASSL